MITNVNPHLTKGNNPFASLQKLFLSRLLFLFFPLLICLAFISCSKEDSPGKQVISKKITNRPVSTAVENTAVAENEILAARIPALDRTEAPEADEVREDPFKPLFREETDPADPDESQPVECTGNTPLQKYDLSQLKLVGIVRTSGLSKAIVENALGKGFIVEKGTKIGIHCGEVATIQEDILVVEERENGSLHKRELKMLKPDIKEDIS